MSKSCIPLPYAFCLQNRSCVFSQRAGWRAGLMDVTFVLKEYERSPGSRSRPCPPEIPYQLRHLRHHLRPFCPTAICGRADRSVQIADPYYRMAVPSIAQKHDGAGTCRSGHRTTRVLVSISRRCQASWLFAYERQGGHPVENEITAGLIFFVVVGSRWYCRGGKTEVPRTTYAKRSPVVQDGRI